MSTSTVYESTRAALRQVLPTVIDSQLDSLGLAIVGVVQSMSSQVAKMARAMPLDTTAHSKEQRLRRLLDNQRLTQTAHYQPIVKQALHGLTHQRVQLLMDRVLIRDVHDDPVKALIARKLLEIGQEMGIGTIVEGIEQEAELSWVRDHGAHFVQGFLLGQPSPVVRT